MKILKLALATLVFAAGNAFAQAPVDVEQKAAVKELLEALNFKQMMSQMAGAMSQTMPQVMDQMVDGVSAQKNLTPEQRADARALAATARDNASRDLRELFSDPQVSQGLEEIMVRKYTKYFSTDEIKAITAFHMSPAGKKSLSIMPQLMQEIMPEIMAVMQPKMMAMMEKTAKDIVATAEKNKKSKDAAATK